MENDRPQFLGKVSTGGWIMKRSEQPFQREWQVSLYLYSTEDPCHWIQDYLNKNKQEDVKVTSTLSKTTGCGRNWEEVE